MSKCWIGISSAASAPALQQCQAQKHQVNCSNAASLNCHHYIEWADLINESYPHLPKQDLLSAVKNSTSFLRKCQAAQNCSSFPWEALVKAWLCLLPAPWEGGPGAALCSGAALWAPQNPVTPRQLKSRALPAWKAFPHLSAPAQHTPGGWEGEESPFLKGTGKPCCFKQEINKKCPKLARKSVRNACIPARQHPWEHCSTELLSKWCISPICPICERFNSRKVLYYWTFLFIQTRGTLKFLKLHCKPKPNF